MISKYMPAILDGVAIGLAVIVVIIIFAFFKAAKELGKRKKISTDYPVKTKLQCTSETPIFSAPAQCACTLFVGENGLEIKVLLDKKTKSNISFLIEYSKLLKVYFEKELLFERPRFGERKKQESIPDYFLVEYKENDCSLQQLRFYQTKKDKEKNKLSLSFLYESDPGFITTINARIEKAKNISLSADSPSKN